MLKNRLRKENRKLLLVLTLSPLPLFLLCQSLQLPSQAQTTPRNSPSRGTAGSESGAPTNASQTSILSNPQAGTLIPITTITTPTGETLPAVVTSVTTPTGAAVVVPIVPNVSATVSTGVSTSGGVSVPVVTTPLSIPVTSPVTNVQPQTLNNFQISTTSVEITSPGATIANNANGNGVVINLTPESQTKLNLAATSITQNIITGTGNSTTSAVTSVFTQGSGAAANSLISNYTAAGVSSQLAQTLVTSITNLLPTGSGTANVNINNLNDAIVAYNAIVIQSGPDTVRSLSQNESFVLIGQTLGGLRSALK